VGKKRRPEDIPYWDISGIAFVHDPGTPRTNLSRLPPAEKRAAWARIKEENPALAELLQSEEVQALIRTFDAEVWVDE